MRFRAVAVLAVVALPLVAGACSSSSKSSSSSSSADATVTTVAAGGDKATFVAQANQACTALAQLPNAPGDLTAATASDLPAWSTWLQNAGTLGDQVMTALRALTPPAGDESTVSDLLAKQQQSLDDGATAQKAAATGDLSGFQSAMTKAGQDGDTASTAEANYGLTTCADPSGASSGSTTTTAGQ